MFPVVSGVAMGQGAAAFAVSLADNSPEPQIVFPEASGGLGNPSAVGAIDFTVSPSGGSGSYTFTWLTIILDNGQGMLSISSQGKTDVARYSNAQVEGGTNAGAAAVISIRCTVSDGVASDIVVNSSQIQVQALY